MGPERPGRVRGLGLGPTASTVFGLNASSASTHTDEDFDNVQTELSAQRQKIELLEDQLAKVLKFIEGSTQATSSENKLEQDKNTTQEKERRKEMKGKVKADVGAKAQRKPFNALWKTTKKVYIVEPIPDDLGMSSSSRMETEAAIYESRLPIPAMIEPHSCKSEKAICKIVKDTAKPIIAERIPQYKIDSVEFEALTLVSLPPTFQGIKHYVTGEKELIMEPSIKWAGNPNIIVAVKAFKLKATIQVTDFQMFLVPRITLKPLVPTFPCFAKIIVSLMEKPHIDFGLKLVGADLMSIPIFYRFVQELIEDQAANMYLWPKKLEVEILDPAKAFRRPIGVLHVKVLKAMNLEKHDIIGSSDPYVKLKLTEDKAPFKKTSVKHENLNPEWNEEFNMLVRDLETQVLKLKLYDWEKFGAHDKMGTNVAHLNEITPEEPKVMTLDLLKHLNANDSKKEKEKSRGQIVLELTFKPFKEEQMKKTFEESRTLQRAPEGTPAGGGQLAITIHEAQDVEGKHHTNPYVRIQFKGEKRKTKPVKKNRNPRWEQEFTFTLEEPPTNEKFHVEVFSSSSSKIGLHPKESLGYIEISLSDVVNNKRINENYHLIDSKNGKIQIELQWRT